MKFIFFCSANGGWLLEAWERDLVLVLTESRIPRDSPSSPPRDTRTPPKLPPQIPIHLPIIAQRNGTLDLKKGTHCSKDAKLRSQWNIFLPCLVNF